VLLHHRVRFGLAGSATTLGEGNGVAIGASVLTEAT